MNASQDPQASHRCRGVKVVAAIIVALLLASMATGFYHLVAVVLPRHKVVSVLKNLEQRQISTSEALEKLGGQQRAADAISRLISRTGSDNRWAREAAVFLGDCGAAGVKPLITLLDSRDEQVRIQAVRSLGALGPAAAKASQAISERLKDSSRTVRAAAAIALGSIKSPGSKALEGLRQAVADEDVEVRAGAVLSLLRLGIVPKEAGRIVQEALVSDNDFAAGTAITALRHHRPLAVKLAPTLAQALGDDTVSVLHRDVIHLLTWLGPDAKPAVDSLVKRLQADDDTTKLEVLNALTAIGPEAKGAIPALAKLAADPSESDVVREFARTALAEIKKAQEKEKQSKPKEPPVEAPAK